MDNLLLVQKINLLIIELKTNKNNSFLFFEEIIAKLAKNSTKKEAIEALKRCYSITQYANFSYKEEKMLDEILEMIDEI